MTVPQYAHLLGTILGELAAWHEFARHGSASGFLPRNGHSRSPRWQSEGLYPSIQYADILHYTKMSLRCVHMILYEKYRAKNKNFGGMDKGNFTS
jgi:hypothetical protein